MSAKGKTAKSKTAALPPTLPIGCRALLSKKQICFALGVSLRTFQSMLSSGEFPKHSIRLGKFPRWTVETLNTWIEARANGGGVQEAE